MPYKPKGFRRKIALVLFFGALVLASLLIRTQPPPAAIPPMRPLPSFPFLAPEEKYIPPADVDSSFHYSWNTSGVLDETDAMDKSSSPYWWLDSGAKLIIADGAASTIQGDLPKDNPWYEIYAVDNPTDTDGGIHPQSLLRLVSRSKWENVRIEASFMITGDHFSASEQRYASNGLLLMNRYARDGQTLYYAGIRVDGTAVIKKKFHGDYYTMAQEQIFPGTYDRDAHPNLLPHDTWIGLRSEITTNADGSVTVKLYYKLSGGWILALVARDDGKKYDNTPPIMGRAYIGIRTDFMDVKFGPFSAVGI